MKAKRIIIIVVELLLVLLVVGAMWFITTKTVASTQVLVYSHDISVGDTIGKNDVSVIEIPGKAINQSFPRKMEDVVGKIAACQSKKGDYVNVNQLVTAEQSEETITLDDLKGMRTKSFAVNMSSALAGCIKKGDRIDLTYVTAVEEGYGNKSVYAKTFMTDVYVWSVNTGDGYAYTPRDGSYWDETTFAGTQKVSSDGTDMGELSIITVMCTPAQVEEISARLQAGSIQISGQFSVSKPVPTGGYTISGKEGGSGVVNVGSTETPATETPAQQQTSNSGSSGGGGLW